MTDNVVRPPDEFHAVIAGAAPSVALWIIQDYVVIPLILIALRFQSKYGNSEAALGIHALSSGRRHWPAARTSSLFTLPSLRIVNKPSNRYVCLLLRRHGDLFLALKPVPSHRAAKTHIYQQRRRPRAGPAAGEMFVSGGAADVVLRVLRAGRLPAKAEWDAATL